ncbi:MAG: hypothetical protein Kapaf2KO_14040 [Candidatus Kapaibacteriales bacterium]
MGLTACIICRNEEDNISQCLVSLIGKVEEVVVNDTGSTDNTVQIVKSYQTRLNIVLVHSVWEEDFSKARNLTLDKASQEWVLVIDADEVLTSDRHSLQSEFSQDDSIGGLLVKAKSYSLNDSYQTTDLLRLFRNRKDIRFKGTIHEQVIDSIANKGLKIIKSEIELSHYGYKDETLLMQKIERNVKLLEKSDFNHHTLFHKLNLIKSYYSLKKYAKAIEIEYVYNLSDSKVQMSEFLLYKSLSYFKINDFDKAKQTAIESIKYNSSNSLALFHLAEIETNIGNNSVAVDLYSRIIDQPFLTSNGLDRYPNDKQKIQSMIDKLSVKDASLPSIALCMIVKNEEENIENCLKSVVGLVDEIKIVDTGSNDNTITKIAEVVKETFIGNNEVMFTLEESEWKDDFSFSRNLSIKNIDSDWILYLDADETIEVISYDALKNSLSKLPEEIGGVICNIQSVHSNLTGSKEMHKGGYPRLFRNLAYPNIHFVGRVHEQITPSLRERGLQLVSSDVIINHHGYNRTPEEMKAKVNRNYKLLLAHVNEEPLNGYAWYQLGQTLGQMELREQSKSAIEFAIQTKSLSGSVLSSAFNTLSFYEGQAKKFEKALDYAEKSLELAPNQLYAMNLKANALLLLGRKEEAKTVFENILSKMDRSQQGISDSGFDIIIPREKVLQGLNRCL